MSDKPKQRNIGGVWIKPTRSGDEMLSIKCDVDLKAGEWYSAFKNDYKQEGDKAPDYRIVPPLGQSPRQSGGERDEQERRPASGDRYKRGEEPF